MSTKSQSTETSSRPALAGDKEKFERGYPPDFDYASCPDEFVDLMPPDPNLSLPGGPDHEEQQHRGAPLARTSTI